MNIENPLTHSSELKTCSLCDSSSIDLLHVIKKYANPFKVDKCSSCGFIFMNPAFSDSMIKSFYDEDYYSGNSEYSYYDEREAKKYSQYVWKKRIKVILKYVSGGNFLDVGSSFGGLLEVASEFYTPYGIELSPFSSQESRSVCGENIHCGTLEDHPYEHENFNVITMIELIEHLSRPVSAIEECYKLLKKEGLLVIQTANMAGLQARLLKDNYAYYMPGHLSYFNSENLKNLLLKTGFRKVKIYYPVEFGLLPKLLKSRYTFNSILDYRKWIRICFYHLIGKIHFGNFAMTSSMVVYAVK